VLGYVEGHKLMLKYRRAEWRTMRSPDLAADLNRFNIDITLTWETPAAQAAKQAISTIPIVMTSSGDAIRTGLVTSLARPGGNVTGLTVLNLTPENKRLELLKEAVQPSPKLPLPLCGVNSTLFGQGQLHQQPCPIAAG
jgi:putative ABC transport system substrate-binding protein